MKQRIIAGITQENEIYFLEIETKSERHNYFSMSGFTVKPMTYDEAVEQSRASLEDDDFLWKQSVESGSTRLGFEAWIDYVLETDGEISMIDTSLYNNTVEVNGIEYVFESGSCGQHEEIDLKHYFIDKKLFDDLMKIWKRYHLQKVNPTLPVLPEQDENKILKKAIRIINDLGE